MQSFDESETAEGRREKILTVVALIPCGEVRGYGEVAAMADLPGRARLVGKILGDLPSDTAIPWHRVLRSDRTIAFQQGSRRYRLQRSRLIAEGILFKGSRVEANEPR